MEFGLWDKLGKDCIVSMPSLQLTELSRKEKGAPCSLCSALFLSSSSDPQRHTQSRACVVCSSAQSPQDSPGGACILRWTFPHAQVRVRGDAQHPAASYSQITTVGAETQEPGVPGQSPRSVPNPGLTLQTILTWNVNWTIKDLNVPH